MRTFTLVSALTVLACAAPGTDSAADSAGADPGDDVFIPNECGEWAAIADGREWAYRYTDDADVTGTWTATVVRFKGGGGSIENSGSSENSKMTYDYTQTSTFVCDGGFYITESTLQYAGTSNGTPYSGETVSTYDEPVLVWPDTLTKGATWDAHYVGTSKSGDTKTDVDFTTTYTVKGLEDVTVKAGTYKTFRVEAQAETGDPSTLWTSGGFGTVKGDGYELTDLR